MDDGKARAASVDARDDNRSSSSRRFVVTSLSRLRLTRSFSPWVPTSRLPLFRLNRMESSLSSDDETIRTVETTTPTFL